jgi:hypothetical protein
MLVHEIDGSVNTSPKLELLLVLEQSNARDARPHKCRHMFRLTK